MNRGAELEGDIFSVLRQSPYVLRSFEFAVADGAVDCTRSFDSQTSFADRFWLADQQQRDPDPSDEPSKLLFFDVKSTTSAVAGHQIYETSINQRRHVAFYICICASEPGFVEIIPNRHQGIRYPLDQESRTVAVNTPRTSRLPCHVYKLDPSGSPYRMPITLLLEAIARIRLCAQGRGHYVNPWTLVTFKDWQPDTTTSTNGIKPAEHTEHFSAYLAVMNIYRHMNVHGSGSDMIFDFVGLQPKLADFKIIINGLIPRQYFIQHKLDARDRAWATPLTKVFIGRHRADDKVVWYFTPDERLVKPVELTESSLIDLSVFV